MPYPSQVRNDVPAAGNATTDSVRQNFGQVRTELDEVLFALASGGGGGATGATGVSGAVGATGPSGAPGASGATGPSGASGAGGGGPPVAVQTAAPAITGNGQLWYNPNSVELKISNAGVWESLI